MLLITLAVLAVGAAGQPFVLSNFEAFYPRIAGCVTPDTYSGPFINVTECGPRSDGCNFDTGYCVLAQIFGYTFGTFIDIYPPVILAALMPGEADGAVNITIEYSNTTFTSPQGILQLWSLFETVSGVEVYKYADREVFLAPAPINVPQTFTFLDLPAGQYRAVFWDWGGTRYGNGIPESSAPFVVANIFPLRLDLALEFVPEYAVNDPTSGIRYPETLITIPNKPYMGYRLTAAGVSEATLVGYLNNAAALGRTPAWALRSDQGNIITITTEKDTVCRPAYAYTTAPAGGTQACRTSNVCRDLLRTPIGQSCPDPSWTRHTLMPMNTGGYGVVLPSGEVGPGTAYTPTRKGRLTVLEFRLNYATMLGQTAYDYWAHRQQYFRTTVVARRKIGFVQVDNTDRQTINNLRSGSDAAAYNHVRRVNAREDLLVVYFVRYTESRAFLFPYNPFNSGFYTGLLQFGMEAYGPYDTKWGNPPPFGFPAVPGNYGSTGFAKLPYYLDHNNTRPNDDFSCWATGSQYAEFKWSDFPFPATADVCSLPECWKKFTFADIAYDVDHGREYMGECTEESSNKYLALGSAWNGKSYVPCENPPSSPIPECSLCCAMNTNLGRRNYPCYAHNPFYQQLALFLPTLPRFPKLRTYFGVSSACSPTDLTRDTFPARYGQFNGLGWDRIISFGDDAEDLRGTYTKYQPILGTFTPSYAVFGTLKDCVAGPIPADYRWGSLRFIGVFSVGPNPPYLQIEDNRDGSDAYFAAPDIGGPFFLVPRFLEFGVSLPTGPVVTTLSGTVFGTAWPEANQFANRPTYFAGAGNMSYNVIENQGVTDLNIYPYPWPPGSPYDYVSDFFTTVGYDTQTLTLQYMAENVISDVNDIYAFTNFTQTTFAYARFKLYPRINFHNFLNAIFPHDALPATIDVEFRVSCPNLEMGYGPRTAYCAQAWTITNQLGADIIVSVTQGRLETDPAVIAASGRPPGQVLAGVRTDEVYIVRVIYTDGDVLHWEFVLAPEAEHPYGASANCNYSTADTNQKAPIYRYQFVPDPVTVRVPPQSYVLLPMILNVASAQPACEYNPQEVRARVKRSQYYSWAVVNDEALSSVTDTGQPSPSQLGYYYDWLVGPAGPGQGRIQGFAESTQLYTPPMQLTVYDHFFTRTTTTVTLLPVDPLYPNPLLRPPRCVSETLANASCPVNLQDSPGFSGIDQYPYCTDGVNSVALSPRFIFIPPYTYLLNVGSCFFNRTTAYIDPFIEDQLYGGVFEDCRFIPFVVDQNTDPSGSVWVSLKVRYGITIQAFFNVPCWERLITNVIILSSFVVTPLPVEYIPLCVRPDGCCYRQPFAVSGTSPYTGQPVNFDNVTDPCYGTPECQYEIVISPPANGDGGLCLGVAYTFVAQSPAALVAARIGPNAAAFPLPWRCPDIVVITLPFGGFSPINVVTNPGPCTRPGTTVRFDFTFTDVNCEGPVSAANDEPLCRRDIYFALQGANGSTAYTDSGAPSLTTPFLLAGINTQSYNNEGSFLFPDQFIPGFPPVPNGFWNAFFWAQPSGSLPPNYAGVVNPGDAITTAFTASLGGVDGIRINRLEYIRPQCPGTPMQLTFAIYDIAFNGPYNISFYSPGGSLIDRVIVGLEYCVGFGIVPINQLLIDCAIQIQSQGISVLARIPTGNISNGETGLYALHVYAEGSECPAVYEEFVVSLETLRVQIECVNTTCPGSRDGYVNTEVTGGTRVPVINITTYQGSNFDIWRPLYYYNWSTPQGPALVPSLLRVPGGAYTLIVTDFNGCVAPPVTCTVGSASSQMVLVPVSQTPPNCTGEFGRANFTVSGGVPPYALYKISNRSVVVTESYSILADATVLPGQNSSYVVIDALGCVSPDVSFFLDGAVRFFLNLVVVAYPCDAFSATGTIRAETPGGLGTVLVWTNLLTGQVVSSSTNCLIGSNCLQITNLPASTYRVVATSTIYGCQTEATVALTARPPPDIQITRSQDPASAFLDRCVGSFFSTNGPPYTVSFFGIDFNVPVPQRPVFTQQPPSGNLAFWTLTNLPAQTTFQLTVTDAGNCLSTITSLGRQITITDPLVTPTPIPGQFSGQPTPIPGADKVPYNPSNDMILVIFVFLVAFGLLAAFLVGYFSYTRRQ